MNIFTNYVAVLKCASGVFDFDPKTGALVCVGKPGINGVYSSFTTDYGEILNIGGLKNLMQL